MYQLNLTDEERILLVELLDGAISDICMEIADTDKREYKMLLKDREVMMKKLFRDMTAMEVATTG